MDAKSRELPKIGETWIHYKGNEYTIISIAKHTEGLGIHIVYTNSKGEHWVRPVDLFMGRSGDQFRFRRKT